MKEFDLIREIAQRSLTKAGRLIQGIGDDCAVIEMFGDKCLLVTTDGLFENVHFRSKWIDFHTLGKKALNVNLSDIAAMGGTPTYYLVTIGIPTGTADTDIRSFFNGMEDAAKKHDVKIIGGDTSVSKKGWQISITALGEVEKDKVLLRSGARIGDGVYVTGRLGGSSIGLEALVRGKGSKAWQLYIDRHNDPAPRVEAGRWLADLGYITSMIDISDGLIQDLGHIVEASRVGFRIEGHQVPVVEGFSSVYPALGVDPWSLLLGGGEEYELAFTVESTRIEEFEAAIPEASRRLELPITRVGEIVPKSEGCIAVNAKGETLEVKSIGYEHEI